MVTFRRGLDHLRKLVPRPTEPEAEKSFTTYKNYLVHIERGLGGTFGVGASFVPSLVADVRSRQKFMSISRRALTPSQGIEVERGLRIGWAKELQLRIPGAFDTQLLPFLIHGSAIHSYYVVFHAARALFAAANQTVASTHATTLSTLSSWTSTRGLFPAPWSVRCIGGPERAQMQVLGKPACARSSGAVHPLSTPSPATVWDSLDMLMCTTRARQVDERKKQWREKNSKLMVPRAEAAKISANLPATTLFNVLYRLRKRSDYSDADAFLDGIPTEEAAEQYHNSMQVLVHGTLTVFETLIVAHVGLDVYQKVAGRFLAVATGPGSDALAERRAVIAGP